MAAQLNYSYSTPKAVPGQKADITVMEEVNIRMNDENDGVLKFGTAVAVGATAGDTVKKPVNGTTSAQIEGVLLHAENTEQDQEGNVIVKKGSPLSVMKKGHVWGRVSKHASVAYGTNARVAVDGEDAGLFTDKSSQYQYYEKCASTETGALKVVASGASTGEIAVADVTPVYPSTYTPAANDYVVQRTAHGATVDIGAKFGKYKDDGIAVVLL